jgi:hypothetical protein
MTMAETQGQFQIIVLEADTQNSSHSQSGPWGTGITSSVPTESFTTSFGASTPIKILPRPNEQSVDPSTLKASRL